ncbi:MAG: 3-isopropylmalate dehydratase small subunit [Prolixibacteraceae bacterium]|nr:3-isopropylmalate dehydratase small subunit [Prolixibacteraceae bacterium]
MSNRCWKLGDNVSTDEILPSQYMTLTDIHELGKHVLEHSMPGFAERIKDGDVIVAGINMGYGSSREHAPLSLKGAGIGLVVAKSFSRLFYRNCINIGLPVVLCPLAVDECDDGDHISVDLCNGRIINNTKSKIFSFDPFPDFLLQLLMKGGLINSLNEERLKLAGINQ